MINRLKMINIKPFLDEDIGSGDITAAIIPESPRAIADVVTRDTMVLCGLAWFDAVFKYLDADVSITWYAAEGETVEPGAVLCKLDGAARALLTGERTALNLLQTLSATATVARQYADAVVGTGFKPPLKGLALAALEWIKPATAPILASPVLVPPVLAPPILAIDLPSGWPTDETAATVDDPVFPADAVITFTAPKPAHVFGQLTRHWSQPIVVAAIGSPDEAMVSELKLRWAGSALALTQTPRPATARSTPHTPRSSV